MNNLYKRNSVPLNEAGDTLVNRLCTYMILKDGVDIDLRGIQSNRSYGNQALVQQVVQNIESGNYAKYLDNATSAEGQIANDFFEEFRRNHSDKYRYVQEMVDDIKYEAPSLGQTNFGLQSLSLLVYLIMSETMDGASIRSLISAFELAAENPESCPELMREIQRHCTFTTMDSTSSVKILELYKNCYSDPLMDTEV